MSPSSPIYFESCWAIVSSLGLLTTLAGFSIVGIVGFTPLWAVPVISSASAAIANGLCFFAYYTDEPPRLKVPVAVIADFFWLIQDCSLPFYSYFILTRFLQNMSRRIFLVSFWSSMVALVGFRVVITTQRVLDIMQGVNNRQNLINNMHTVYFSVIAAIEILSAYYLLRIFTEGQKGVTVLSAHRRIFTQIIQSTEVRVSSLALIGVGRAITYSFQTQAQSADSAVSQLDRFLLTLEVYFPVIMLLDVLSPRVINTLDRDTHSSAFRRSERVDDINVELNRMNESNRQGMPRQTFVVISAKSDGRKDSDTPTISDEGILKSVDFIVERSERNRSIKLEDV